MLPAGEVCFVILPTASVSADETNSSVSRSLSRFASVQSGTDLYYLKSFRVTFFGCPLKSNSGVSITPPVSKCLTGLPRTFTA